MNLPVYNGPNFFKLLHRSESYANFKQKSGTVMWRKYHVMMVYFLSQLQRWMGMIRSARECHWSCINTVCYKGIFSMAKTSPWKITKDIHFTCWAVYPFTKTTIKRKTIKKTSMENENMYLFSICFLAHIFSLVKNQTSSREPYLTHYQMTNFRLFQTERVCRRQFQIWRKWKKIIQTWGKHCGKRRNCSLRAISPFPAVFSKGLFPRGVKRCHCLGMG